ncbi:MAG TPA: PD-(D/E)XK nuclease family protein, partial [Tepidisphaeraceae bacterium]|nr:PD-(D/E)XK nuclease family protein [Tepidisphaeraceae bacterium]
TSDDMAALVHDLERAGVGRQKSEAEEARDGDPSAIRDPQSEIAPELRALHAKFSDLRLLYDAYSAYLGQERLDRHRRLEQVLTCIATSGRLRGATAYIDAFGQFTEFELRVIAALGKACRTVEVTLTIDPASPLLANPHLNPEDLSPFHSVEDTYRRLWATLAREGVAVDGPIVLRDVHRFRTEALQLVERDVVRRLAIHRDVEAREIEMIQAEHRRAEVDAVARRIRELCTSGGVRLREIAVLLRDLEEYHELIAASFREHDIAYFVDRRRAVAHHPLLGFLRGVLQVVQQGWPHDGAMSILKSGLTGLTDAEADELENYVLAHRIRGGGVWTQSAPWGFARRMLGAEDEDPREIAQAARVDALRRKVVGPIQPLVKALAGDGLTLRRIVLAVFDLFDRFQAPEAVAKWMAAAQDEGRFEQRDEHAQAWKTLVELLDQMVELLGDEPATLADFVDIYEAGVESFELALTPPTLDQVLVGQVDRTRTPDLKVVIVMGLNEGVFPKMPREDTVLSDAERRELRTRRLDVDPDTHRKLLDENLLGYTAFTRASERLILTRALAGDGGKPLGPSRFWDRFLELFPKLKGRVVNVAGEGENKLEAVGTPRQLITTLMEWVRGLGAVARPQATSSETNPQSEIRDPQSQHSALSTQESFRALYHWLATRDTDGSSIDVMRFRAWRALQYANGAKLSKAVVRELFGDALHASVTRIETFAACGFKHFARFGLDLRERDEEEAVSPLDLGNVFHHVLEKIVRVLVERKQGWPDLPVAERERLIHEMAQQVGKELKGEILLSSARNRYLLQRIEATLGRVAAAQDAAARRGNFAPAYAELTFGPATGADLPAMEIPTPGGHRLVLSGKIDRVDVTADQSAFAVIDYKLSGKPLSLANVYHGLSLQLLTYLLVLRENGEKLAGRKLTPAAALYVKLLRDLEDVGHPSEVDPDEDPARLDLREKPRGLLHANYVRHLDTAMGPGVKSDVVAAHEKKEGGYSASGSDVAEEAEFEALIDHVRDVLARMTDQLLGGHIEISPYYMRKVTPCPYCEFRSLCRFDPSMNKYTHLNVLSRAEVLKRVVEERK